MGLATIVGWVIILAVLGAVGGLGYWHLVRPRLESDDDSAAGDEAVQEGEGLDLSLEYDARVFTEYQNRMVRVDHQLLVREPGAGVIDLREGEIVEELESPVEGHEFVNEIEETDDGRWAVLMRTLETGDRHEVARVPKVTGVPA